MKVKVVYSDEDFALCCEIRRRVFTVEQNVPEDLEWDGKDDEARHLLIHDGAQPAGTLRIRRLGNTGYVERVAVQAACRRRGLGDALVLAALDLLRSDPDIECAKLAAQIGAIGFYEKHGFTVYGPVYDDAGIPHRDMVLEF